MLERFLQVVPSRMGCEGFAEESQINSTEETPQEEKDTISQRHVDSTGNYCAGKNRAKENAAPRLFLQKLCTKGTFK